MLLKVDLTGSASELYAVVHLAVNHPYSPSSIRDYNHHRTVYLYNPA